MAQTPPPPPAAKKAKRCGLHPRYEGKNPPRSACLACWRLYLSEKYGMGFADRTIQGMAHVVMNDMQEIVEFTKALKAAAVNSKQRGGQHSAFLHGKTSDVHVEVKL